MAPKTYKVLGMMSGSSLDGLDLAYCELMVAHRQITGWQLIHTETVPFSEQWQRRLFHLPQQDALTYAKTHTYFGRYTSELVRTFIAKHQLEPDLIASHGHTIFHYPDKRMTAQIGDGAALAALTGYPVVCDFRTQDVALDGEGAPLAPLADHYLFPEYDLYLNIGGIANLTCKAHGKFRAFDTAPANQVLNALAQLTGQPFDRNGTLARRGTVQPELLESIDALPYFHRPYPKSMDNQWVQKEVLPHYLEFEATVEDRLATACEQLARQTARAVADLIRNEKLEQEQFSLLATGGGAFNGFLMERIETLCNEQARVRIIVPEAPIVEFKEALLIALLGVLRIENIPNSMQSVTGAQRDTINGAIYQGYHKTIG